MKRGWTSELERRKREMINRLADIYLNFKLCVFFYLGNSFGLNQASVESNDDGEVVSIKLTNQELNLKKYYSDEK